MKQNKYYKSTSLSLVATLSMFFPIEQIDSTNPNKSEFLFARSDELDQLIEAYWRGTLKVNPQTYFNQLKNVKSRLYEERKRCYTKKV